MSLDLPRVLPQIQQMGETAARRSRELALRVPQARAALHAAAGLAPEDWARRLERAGKDWRGARPSHEPVDSARDSPPHPDRLEVIGADGSQVYPDRHAAALYFLVNIGSLHLIHGSGRPPSTASVTSRRGGAAAVRCSACLPWKSPVSRRTSLSSDMSKGSVSWAK